MSTKVCSAAGLFKYMWPFSGHQALKGESTVKDVVSSLITYHLEARD